MVLRRRRTNAPPATITINAPATPAMTALAPPDDDDPAATTRLGAGEGEANGGVDCLTVFDARGDGFADGVGVGDTGTTAGLAVAVAVGFIREWVGVGVGDIVVPVTVTLPVMYVWIEQWYENVPALLNVQEKLLPGARFPE
jgi:hypothetical protein